MVDKWFTDFKCESTNIDDAEHFELTREITSEICELRKGIIFGA